MSFDKDLENLLREQIILLSRSKDIDEAGNIRMRIEGILSVANAIAAAEFNKRQEARLDRMLDRRDGQYE